VRPSHASLLAGWISSELSPLLREHRRLAQASVRRKVGVLRQAVGATLEARLLRARGVDTRGSVAVSVLDTELRHAAGRFEEARLTLAPYREVPESLADDVWHAAARVLVESQHTGVARAALAAGIEAAIAAAVSEHFRPVGRELRAVARDVTGTLERASLALNLPEAPLVEDWQAWLREMPRLDARAVAAPLGGRWTGLLPRAVCVGWIRRRLRADRADQLAAILGAHALVVHAWATGILTRYRREFEAQAEVIRAQLGPRGAPGAEDDAGGLEHDLQRLRTDDEPDAETAERAAAGG
jgi:hypothetical protein